MDYVYKTLAIFLVSLLLDKSTAFAEPSGRFEVEAGVVTTKTQQISGYKQGNTTANWKSQNPTARIEYWTTKNDAWNYGIVAQPLRATYSDTLRSDLNIKGKVYKSGEKASLDYQFHTLRGSANYPVLASSNNDTYLRLGGSLVARYADLKFSGENQSFKDTNFIVVPLIHLETAMIIVSDYGFLLRTDFLPSPEDNVFLDGLFDVLFAVRKHFDLNRSIDLGIRLFFGGYDPKKPDDYANKIFFTAAVMRYSW